MSSSFETLAADAGQINPEILQFFADYGEVAVDAYARTGVFHATHGRNVESILRDGLAVNGELIDAEDEAFISDMFQKYGSRHPHDIWMFNHYILGQRDGEDRGIYLFLRRPDNASAPEDTYYGIPERVQMMIPELFRIASKDIGTQEEIAKAKELHAKYVERVLGDNAEIALLEVNPFAPAIINHRLGNINNLRDVTDMETIEVILSSDAHDLNLVNTTIAPEYLAVRSRWPVETKLSWSDHFTRDRGSIYFPEPR